jgi:hypothetical protein
MGKALDSISSTIKTKTTFLPIFPVHNSDAEDLTIVCNF